MSLILAIAFTCQHSAARAAPPELPGVVTSDLDEDEHALLLGILKQQFDPCGKSRSFLESVKDPKTCALAPRLATFVVGQIQRGLPKREIVRALLKEQKRLTVRHKFTTKDRPAIGPKDAKVVVVEFYDFQCPFCRVAAEKVLGMAKKHKGVRFVHKQLPLQYHQAAKVAAIVALAAHWQGRFRAIHDALFAAQADLTDEKVLEIAEKAGLDMKRYASMTKKAQGIIEADRREADLAGVDGTPSFYVNGLLVDFNELERAVEAELATPQ